MIYVYVIQELMNGKNPQVVGVAATEARAIAMVAALADDHQGRDARRLGSSSIIDAEGYRWDYHFTRHAAE